MKSVTVRSPPAFPEEVATEIFDTMSAFAEYAFNKSHATAYAYISFRTAYLKAHYPCEYLASLLTSVLGNMTKTAVYVDQAQKMKIAVLGPDINESRETYSVVSAEGKKAIRFGLLGVKNVGRTFLAEVIEERSTGKFTSFENFVSRMSGRELNKRQVESLIKSGAFDSLGTSRAALLSEYEKIIDIYMKKSRSRLEGQFDLFTIGNAAPDDYPEPEYTYPDIPDLPRRKGSIRKRIAWACTSPVTRSMNMSGTRRCSARFRSTIFSPPLRKERKRSITTRRPSP